MAFPFGFFSQLKLAAPDISRTHDTGTGSITVSVTSGVTGATLYANIGTNPPTTSRTSPYSVSVGVGSTIYAQNKMTGYTDSDVSSDTNDNDPGGGG